MLVYSWLHICSKVWHSKVSAKASMRTEELQRLKHLWRLLQHSQYSYCREDRLRDLLGYLRTSVIVFVFRPTFRETRIVLHTCGLSCNNRAAFESQSMPLLFYGHMIAADWRLLWAHCHPWKSILVTGRQSLIVSMQQCISTSLLWSLPQRTAVASAGTV